MSPNPSFPQWWSMTASLAPGFRQRSGTEPVRSREELSSTKAESNFFRTWSGRRIVEAPGRKRSVAGRGESNTTSGVFPISRNASAKARQEPTASPSGSMCAVTRNSSRSARNASNPANAASFIVRLLNLTQELVDARAPLDGAVDLEMKLGDDPKPQSGREKATKVRSRSGERLEHGRLHVLRQPPRDPDPRQGQVPGDLRSGHREHTQPGILRLGAQDFSQLDLDPVGHAARSWALFAGRHRGGKDQSIRIW